MVSELIPAVFRARQLSHRYHRDMADGPARAELNYLQVTLRELRVRHGNALLASLEARVALEHAERVAAARSHEEHYLRTRCDELERDLTQRRRLLRRAARAQKIANVQRLLARFPPELLQAIFVETVGRSGGRWAAGSKNWDTPFYSYSEAVPPFSLAAVNRRWRNLALHTPVLWTFITVPAIGGDGRGSNLLDYVSIMLDRSRTRAVDFLLCWSDCQWDSSIFYGLVLDTLARAAHLWRKVAIGLPLDTPEVALRVLCLPLPRLEDFRMRSTMVDVNGCLAFPWTATSPTYFPFTPHLRRLRSVGLFAVPRLPLAELVSLFLTTDESVSPCVISQFVRMAPSLRELQLTVLSEGSEVGTIQTAAVPNLEVLGLHGAFDSYLPPLMALHMPRLREFRTVNIDAVEPLSPLFEHIADTVDRLVLSNLGRGHSLSEHELQFIRKLKKLRQLVFHDCTHMDSRVPELLVSRDASGLPHLESVTFEDPRMDDEQAGVVSALMLSLHAQASSGKEGAIQFFLHARSGAMPEWFMRQYRFMKGIDDGTAPADHTPFTQQLAPTDSSHASDDSSDEGCEPDS